MKSIVELDIDAPRRTVVSLFADPNNMTRWMHDLERYEHLSGDFGMPGSRYRMVPKAGAEQMEFVSTVTASNLPDRLVLKLESPAVDVSVTATFTAVSDRRTRMLSEEIFTFHGPFNKLFSRLASRDIRRHHREHIESFKRFAESAR